VHFYGDENERGWVLETSVIAFDGHETFDQLVERMVREFRRERKNFIIPANRRQAWNLAVADAESAYMMPRQKRVEAWLDKLSFADVESQDVNKKIQVEKSLKSEVVKSVRPDGKSIIPDVKSDKTDKREREAKQTKPILDLSIEDTKEARNVPWPPPHIKKREREAKQRQPNLDVSKEDTEEARNLPWRPPHIKKREQEVKQTKPNLDVSKEDTEEASNVLPPPPHIKKREAKQTKPNLDGSKKDTEEASNVLPPPPHIKKREAKQTKPNLDGSKKDTEEASNVPPPPPHIKLPKNVSNQQIAQFTVFCQKRRISIHNENPGASEEQIDLILQDLWNRLDNETKVRFIPMGSDVTHLSQIMSSAAGEGCLVHVFCTLSNVFHAQVIQSLF